MSERLTGFGLDVHNPKRDFPIKAGVYRLYDDIEERIYVLFYLPKSVTPGEHGKIKCIQYKNRKKITDKLYHFELYNIFNKFKVKKAPVNEAAEFLLKYI